MAAFVSNTARVACPPEQQPVTWNYVMEEFSAYGEVARLDISLSAIMGSMLVTFFDARVTARLLLEFPGEAEYFPGQPHDFRAVKVSMASVGELLISSHGGFGAFGSVANCSVVHGDVVVEFFDMRAAQRLLAVVGPSGSPWPQLKQEPMPSLAAFSLKWPTLQHTAEPALPIGLLPETEGTGYASSTFVAAVSQALATDPLALAHATLGDDMHHEGYTLPFGDEEDQQRSSATRGGKLVQSKVTNEDFSKYDILPDKIQNNEDLRTTVMVRNLMGASAKEGFLSFLDVCGLSDRYTFFYMPFNSQRNAPTGFAFINFVDSNDVLRLYLALQDRVCYHGWQGIYPKLSYARYQGHEQLEQHFNNSAVMHVHDWKQRPIFHANAGQRSKGSKSKKKDQNVVSEVVDAQLDFAGLAAHPQQHQADIYYEDAVNGWGVGA